jgi:hypothetical protein
MRRHIVFVLLVLVLAVVVVPAGSAYSADHPNAQAQGNCETNIAKQIDRGLAASGGTKDGLLAPTNCDHFFNG